MTLAQMAVSSPMQTLLQQITAHTRVPGGAPHADAQGAYAYLPPPRRSADPLATLQAARGELVQVVRDLVELNDQVAGDLAACVGRLARVDRRIARLTRARQLRQARDDATVAARTIFPASLMGAGIGGFVVDGDADDRRDDGPAIELFETYPSDEFAELPQFDRASNDVRERFDEFA